MALLTDSRNNIFAVIRDVANNFSLADASLGLWVIVEAVVEALVNSEKLVTAVNVFAEVNIVDLVDISLVHVAAEEALHNWLRGIDAEQVKHAKELILCDVAVASNVVVLENWLQVDALVLHLGLVLLKDLFDLLLHGRTCKVLASSKKSVILSDGGNASGGSLVDALNSESSVDVLAEVDVAEEALRVRGFVLLGQGLELIVSEGEVHGGED